MAGARGDVASALQTIATLLEENNDSAETKHVKARLVLICTDLYCFVLFCTNLYFFVLICTGLYCHAIHATLLIQLNNTTSVNKRYIVRVTFVLEWKQSCFVSCYDE